MIKQLQNEKYKFINLKPDKSPRDGNNWKENYFTYDEYKSGNVGIITGHNDLRVIDLDIKQKDRNGIYHIIPEWVEQAEEFLLTYIKELGPTLIIKTTSGGYHIYLHSEYNLPNQAYIKFSKNVEGEFRTHNSFIVAPPSIVNNSPYSVFRDKPIHTVSKKDIANFIVKYSTEEKIYGNRTDVSNSGDDMSVLCSLIKKNFSRTRILQIMDKIPHWHSQTQAYKDFTVKKALQFLNLKKLSDDEEEVEFKTYNIQDMLEKGIPKIEYTIDPFLLKNGITMFVAPPASMKSFLAQQLAISCATGIPFLEKFETKQNNVLYLDEENGIIGIANRIQQLMKGHKIDLKELNNNLTCISYESMRFDNDNKFNELRRIIKKLDIKIIIVDSIVRFVDGDENKSGDIKHIFDKLKSLCNEFELSILVLHHATKTNGRSPRGSGDFLAAPDNVFSISKTSETLIIKSEKERFKKNQDDGHIIKIISYDDKVKLMYDKPFLEKENKKEKCLKHIKKFIDLCPINTFKSRDLKKYLDEHDIKTSTMYDCLRELVSNKIIKCVSAGSKSNYLIIDKEAV